MTLNAYLAQMDADAAAVDYFDALLPGWEDRERFGDTLLDERDFPLDDHEVGAVSDDDWAFFIESTYVDPFERV